MEHLALGFRLPLPKDRERRWGEEQNNWKILQDFEVRM